MSSEGPTIAGNEDHQEPAPSSSFTVSTPHGGWGAPLSPDQLPSQSAVPAGLPETPSSEQPVPPHPTQSSSPRSSRQPQPPLPAPVTTEKQSVPEVPPGPAEPRGRSWGPLAGKLIGIGIAATLAAVGFVSVSNPRGSPTTTASVRGLSSTAYSAPAAPSRSTPTPEPSTKGSTTLVDRQSAAEQRLIQLVAQDSPQVSARIDSRWVAVLASKTDRTTDPLQTTASGGHVFRWADVLEEHMRLRSDPRFGANVLIYPSTRTGSGRTDPTSGRPYLVTIADMGFGSRDEVLAWCASTFSDLPEKQRVNACVAGRLRPRS